MDFIKNFTKAIESLADFQPHMFNGATEKELFALEEKLGLTLPSDFKVFYQTYNGQDDCADYLFDFFPILKINAGESTSERDEQIGYMQIFSGCMTGIRNPRAHECDWEDSEQRALQLLVWANHLVERIRLSEKAQ